MIVRRNSGPEISPVDPPLRGLAFATWLRAGSPRASSPVVIDAVRRSGAFLLFPEIQYPDFAPLSLDIPVIFIHFISIDRLFHPTGLRKESEHESLYRCH